MKPTPEEFDAFLTELRSLYEQSHNVTFRVIRPPEIVPGMSTDEVTHFKAGPKVLVDLSFDVGKLGVSSEEWAAIRSGQPTAAAARESHGG